MVATCTPSATFLDSAIKPRKVTFAEGKNFGSFDSLPAEDILAILPLLAADESSPVHPDLLALVANVLEAVVASNELQEEQRGASSTARLTVFHGLRAPPISIEAYVERLAKYSKCSPICFVFALSYMATLARQHASLQPTTLNVHRLLLTSTMLAAKFTDDHYYNNAFYAKVGGISIAEMNRLEKEMLRLLDYQLYMSSEALLAAYRSLESGAIITDAFLETSNKQACSQGGSSGSMGRKRRSHSESEERPATRRSLCDERAMVEAQGGYESMDMD